jgi:hypothetical protein
MDETGRKREAFGLVSASDSSDSDEEMPWSGIRAGRAVGGARGVGVVGVTVAEDEEEEELSDDA